MLKFVGHSNTFSYLKHLHHDKMAEELLAEPRSPQGSCEDAIERKKGIEHSRTMKSNSFGKSRSTAIKQESLD